MDIPHKQSVYLGDRRVDYREQGNGKTICFLHGMNGESGTWINQFKALSARYRVVAWDAPGYGKSSVCSGTIADLAAIALEFLDAIGAQKPLVVGHSMGGVIAGRLAIDHSPQLSGLVLSCSHAGWGDTPGLPLRARYTKRIEELERMTTEEFGALRASKMVSPDTSEETRAYLAELSAAVTVDGLKTIGRANQEADNLPGLSALSLPCFILSAENDKVIKFDLTTNLLKAMPAAQHTTLTGVGHAPYIEDPVQYNGVISKIAGQVFG